MKTVCFAQADMLLLQPTTGNEDPRWSAVLHRTAAVRDDGSADEFLYGVTSTGVVCRPTCPSRRPHRENVRFFDSLEAAQLAGFRPCGRCRPDAADPKLELAAKIDRARRFLEMHVADTVPLARLAAVAGLSPFHFQRSFRAALGVTPAEYARRLRTMRFEGALDGGTVTDAIYAAGYGSASRVYSRAAKVGMSPGTHKRGGAGKTIGYAIAESPLGRMLVAATDQGVCSIAFADADEYLLSELRARFSAAELHENHAGLAGALREVLAHLEEPALAVRFPLHVRATAFQERVWKALRAIPRGETRTYAEVAAEIGQPAAARAVARACATNPVAVVVPCHRVVGTGGSLTGYRWGTERKRKLLEMERG